MMFFYPMSLTLRFHVVELALLVGIAAACITVYMNCSC